MVVSVGAALLKLQIMAYEKSGYCLLYAEEYKKSPGVFAPGLIGSSPDEGGRKWRALMAFTRNFFFYSREAEELKFRIPTINN
jgi:hypothetical protein